MRRDLFAKMPENSNFNISSTSFFSTISNSKSTKSNMTTIDFISPSSTISLFKPQNFLIVVTLFVELIQLSIFAVKNVPVTSEVPVFTSQTVHSTLNSVVFTNLSSNSTQIAQYILLDFTALSPLLIYQIQTWICIFLVGLFILVFLFQVISELRWFGILNREKKNKEANSYFFHSFFGSVIYGHGIIKNVPSWIANLVVILADTILLMVCDKLLNVLVCDYASETITLKAMPDIICWEYDHKLVATLSLISFSIYLPLASMIGPLLAANKDKDLHSSENDSNDSSPIETSAQFIQPFLSLVVVVKCMIAVLSGFFGEKSQLADILATFILCSFMLFFSVCWLIFSKPFFLFKPASHGYLPPSPTPIVTLLRIAGFAGGIWGSIVCAISKVFKVFDLYAQLCIIGSGLLIIISVIFYFYKSEVLFYNIFLFII